MLRSGTPPAIARGYWEISNIGEKIMKINGEVSELAVKRESAALTPSGCKRHSPVCNGAEAPAFICSSLVTGRFRREVKKLETGGWFSHSYFYGLQGYINTVGDSILTSNSPRYRLLGIGLDPQRCHDFPDGADLVEAPRVFLADAIDRARSEILLRGKLEREMLLVRLLDRWTRWDLIKKEWFRAAMEVKTRWMVDNLDSASRITYLMGREYRKLVPDSLPSLTACADCEQIPDYYDQLEIEWRAGNERLVLHLPVPVARLSGVAINSLRFDIKERIGGERRYRLNFEDEIIWPLPFLCEELTTGRGGMTVRQPSDEDERIFEREDGIVEFYGIPFRLNGAEHCTHGSFYAEYSFADRCYVLKRQTNVTGVVYFWTQAEVEISCGEIFYVRFGRRAK